MQIKLDEIYILRKAGVFCIKNEEYKLAYVSHSSCILQALGRCFYKPSLDKEIYGIQNCKVEILQEATTKPSRLVHLTYWKAKLIEQGYKLVGNIPSSTHYKLTIGLYEDFRLHPIHPLAYVKLTSQKANTLVIGIFDTLEEAEAWTISTYGSLNPINIIPKFSTNSLTMLYISNYINK